MKEKKGREEIFALVNRSTSRWAYEETENSAFRDLLPSMFHISDLTHNLLTPLPSAATPRK